MSEPKPAYKVRALISKLVMIWCDELTNNQRQAFKRKASPGRSALLEFLDTSLNH